jgi:predicted nucleic acid-binding protein
LTPVALLDTTVLIDLGRRAASPFHRRARDAVARLLADGHTLFTFRINEAEFRVGPERSADREKEARRVERILSGIAILEFDAEAALRYAKIKAILMGGRTSLRGL